MNFYKVFIIECIGNLQFLHVLCMLINKLNKFSFTKIFALAKDF